MTAHTRTANLAPGFTRTTTAHTSNGRLIVIAASFLLEAVIVLGFVSSSVGLGAAPYPDPDRGWASAPPTVAPASGIEAKSEPVLEPVPTPAPAPEP